MRRVRRGLAVAITAALFGALPLVASADVGIDDLTAVGLAFDSRSGRVFVAGEGDGGAVAIFDEAGKRSGEVTFSGKAESVQALALDGGVLHVADIGDPGRNREFVTVFGMAPEAGRQAYKAWDFSYPDGPHDAKAFLVSGKGRFYFITDGDDPGIYRAELNPGRQGVNKLTRAADAPRGVTDAAFLADGETMLVRTGDGVALIDAFTWKTTASVTYVDAPGGESVTPFGSGRMLVGATSPLRKESLPKGSTTATPVPGSSPGVTSTAESVGPTATATSSVTATPSATSTPSATATASAPDEGADVTYEVSRSGTLLALAGAAVLSLIAGAFVYFRRQ